MLFCRQYFSPLNTFMRNWKDPESFCFILKTYVLLNFNCFPIFDDFRKKYFFVETKFRFFSKMENSNGSTLNLILLEYRNFFGRPIFAIVSQICNFGKEATPRISLR